MNKTEISLIIKQEVPLVAVVTPAEIDAYSKQSKALLPILHTPILHYTFPAIVSAGVKEIYFFCWSKHINDLQEQWNQMQRRHQWRDVLVHFKPCEETGSVGECLRWLYAEQSIAGDFILLRSDTVIYKLNLAHQVDIYRRHKQHDPDTVMLMILSPPTSNDATLEEQEIKEDPVVSSQKIHGDMRHHKLQPTKCVSVLCDLSFRVLHYERMQNRTQRFKVPSYVYKNGFKAGVKRAQLGDSGLFVCSANLLTLYQDHFDCNTTDQIISEVAHPESLNEANVYSFITEGCTSVATWSDVEWLSWHLLLSHRTSSAITGRTKYKQIAQQRLGQGASAPPDCFPLSLGEGTQVDPSACVCGSTLGAWNTVGAGATLISVMSGDNCQIQTGVHAERCFLGENVTLAVGAKCCVVEAGLTLANYPPSGSYISWLEGGEPVVHPLREGGDWIPKTSNDPSTDPDNYEEISSDFSSEDEDEVDTGTRTIISFRKEMEETIFSAYKDVLSKELVEKTLFEMRSSRSAFNLQYEEFQNISLESMLRAATATSDEARSKDELHFPPIADMRKGLKKLAPVLQESYRSSSVEVLDTLVRIVSRNKCLSTTNIITRLLVVLHEDTNMLDDEVEVLEWFNDAESDQDVNTVQFLHNAAKFIDWLKNQEEDDSEEDESEEESESE